MKIFKLKGIKGFFIRYFYHMHKTIEMELFFYTKKSFFLLMFLPIYCLISLLISYKYKTTFLLGIDELILKKYLEYRNTEIVFFKNVSKINLDAFSEKHLEL